MERRKLNNLQIENAKLVFKNFSGKQGKFNPEGKRNFCVIIDEEMVEPLCSDGWKIKRFKQRDDELPEAYLPVSVAFENFPPTIFMISNGKKTQLDEESVGSLDWAEIQTCDVVIRPYCWVMSDGKSGVKAYLKTMYVTIEEDKFASKYADPQPAVMIL